MVYQDKSLFNTREFCREQILRYLDYYGKENSKEIGTSFISSISQYVGKIVDDVHGPHFFCDEIDVEILFAKYVEYKNLDLSQYSDDFIKMLMGYMARRLQCRVNMFYKLLRDEKFSVIGENVLSSKDKDMFLRKIRNLIKEKPKIIRKH